MHTTPRDSIHFDVLIIGAGPAGLCAGIRYAQLCDQAGIPPSVCIIEKGSQVGAHILSGAVFEPRALTELIPEWKALGAPLNTLVTHDKFTLLTQNKSIKLPTPPKMDNTGNYIISLANLCRWLAQQAENLGVQIYPGFAGQDILLNDSKQVIGITTGDKGVDKSGHPKSNFQRGMNIFAQHTIFAEGARGSLSQKLIHLFKLQNPESPQTYGLGIKEIWEIPANQHQLGHVTHTIGWPLDAHTYGGGFLYHLEKNRLAIGLIVGLDYQNPYLSAYEEFQRFKHHPHIKNILHNGTVLSYGARSLTEGGLQSIPTLTFPGGMLVGCSAGFMNVAKLKGSHTAMKSGMLAAEALFEKTNYTQKIKKSWIYTELFKARNIRPGFQWGLWAGLAWAAFDSYIFKGQAPWTLQHRADYLALKPAAHSKIIHYPKPDGILSFDKMTSISRSHLYYEENQPNHLILRNPSLAITLNLKIYDAPEQRYCPAGVYEILKKSDQSDYLQINSSNCIHCKACDIKDPTQNITWVPPQGADGPNYSDM